MKGMADLAEHESIDVQTVVIPAHADSGFCDARPLGERFKVALRQHWLECADGWLRLWLRPIATLLAMFAMGFALALPAGLFVVLDNGRHLVQSWPMDNQVSVYFNPALSDQSVRRLLPEVRAMRGVTEVELVSKESALKSFSSQSGFLQTIEELEENPLPVLLIVSLADELSDIEVRALADRLTLLAGVDTVSLDADWFERLASLVQVAQSLLTMLVVALGTALVLVVLSATRLAIQERRGEIRIKRLFGATQSHLKRPFLYMGFWLGFWSSLLAVLLAWIAIGSVQVPLESLLNLYQVDAGFNHLTLSRVTAIFVLGVGFAWLGAWLATQQDLS